MPHPNDVDGGSLVGVAVSWLWQKGNDRYEWARNCQITSKTFVPIRRSVRDKEEGQSSEPLGTCSLAGAPVLSTKASTTQFVICVATTRFKHGTKRLLQ